MFTELENLSTLELTKENAKQIVELVSKKLKDTLNAHIVDIMWKREAQDGVILDPLVSIDTSSRERVKPYQIGRGDREGIWSWVYLNGKSIWIENIKTQNLENPVRNLATGEKIESRYLDIFSGTDSIMATPLICRGTVWGIYSVESPRSGIFNEEALKLMERIARPITLVVWRADIRSFDQSRMSATINRFSESIGNVNLRQLLQPYRAGFIARPYESEFSDVEDAIKKILEEKKIQAQHYIQQPGLGYALDHLQSQISDSHFGIVDITGCNPNVMIELGIMLMLRKKLLLLRRMGDSTDVPFDIRPYTYYEYDMSGPGLRIWDPATNRYFASIEEALQPFIREFAMA